MVSFTGSTAVGQRIAEVCGRDMKRQLMELGGKGAALVFDDADLGSAVAGIGTTFSFYSGQICTAPTRVLAQRGVYDRLVEQLAAYARRLPVGNPREAATVVGPVISAEHRDRVEAYVETGRKEGAVVVAGGERPPYDRGFYVAPTLLADCTNDMRVAREEIFGPVVSVIPFDEEEEGIALANDTDYGPRVPRRPAAAGRRGRRQHRRPQHGGAVRRLQEERGGTGRRLVRAARVQRGAGDRVAGVTVVGWRRLGRRSLALTLAGRRFAR
jgi:acyl-CoA reductase-like NAD-dependent aldehyde dehydrogenase